MDSLSCPPRFGTPRDLDAPTHGPNIAYFAAQLGTPFIPWQQHVADVATEVNPDTGRLRYREVVITVPRQSGKTAFLLAKSVWRALSLGAHGPQRLVYTAQDRNSAKQKFEEEQVPLLWYEGSPFAPYMKSKPRTTNGSEGIRWRNGSTYGLLATKETSGHGKSLDDGTIDEAFAQVDTRLEQAFIPAMNTRPEPQLYVVSSAGWSDRPSYLWPKVQLGRELVAEQLQALAGGERHASQTAYFEWSAPEGADPFDEALWATYMPALGVLTPVEAIRFALDKAVKSGKLADFERAYMNLWVRSVELKVKRPIPPAAWEATLDRQSSITDPVVFAVGVREDLGQAYIAAVGRRTDGALHAEIIDARPGTTWVVPRLVELRASWSPTAIGWCKAGPAGVLAGDAIAAGLDAKTLSSTDLAAAYGDLYSEITTVDDEDRPTRRRFYHLDSPALAAAVDGAVKHELPGGAWYVSRTRSSADVAPLEAVALGVLLHKMHPEVPVIRSAYEDETRSMYV